jgi:hypothetical protein
VIAGRAQIVMKGLRLALRRADDALEVVWNVRQGASRPNRA